MLVFAILTLSVNHTTQHTQRVHTMNIDYTDTNEYPRIETVQNVTTSAVKITLPRDCTSVSFGSAAALHFGNTGESGDTFGASADITAYGFVPANNMFNLPLETGRQSNRSLLVSTQSGTAALHLVIIKEK